MTKKPERKLHEANHKIADWGGFTAAEMVEHALALGIDTDITCKDEATKQEVSRILRGKHGAGRVTVLTLDEYEARVMAEYRRIEKTAVTPATTEFANPEPEEAPPVSRGRRRSAPEAAPAEVVVNEDSGAERVRVSRRSKKMINPAYAPKKRGA